MFLAAHSVSLLVLFTIQDAIASEWNVTYEQLHICAVEGSSVDMSCSYTYPRDRILEKVFWTIRNSPDPPDLIQDEKYKERIRTDCGDRKSGSCTLNLRGVKREDAVIYYCRIVTDGLTYGKYLGRPGVTLYLTDLNVRGAQSAKEGDIVTLTCENTCPQRSSPSFMWSKDGHPVEKKRSINNQMQLHPVRYEDGGNYTCAVEGHEDRPSPAMILNVQYPPRNTLVSITFSMETLEGAIVTLTCSSDANPPVEIYTWFKVGESTPVGSGQQYNITNFSSEDGGQYYCEARNEHGAYNSTAVSITVTGKHGRPNMQVVIGVLVGALLVTTGGVCVRYCVKKSNTNGGRGSAKVSHMGNISDTVQMSSPQSLNPNTTQPDAVYQSPNPNKTQPDAVYESMNPNTIQADAVYQSMNPNTTQPDAVYQSMNPNTTQPDAVYQSMNPNTTQPDVVYQSMNPNTTQPDAVYESMNPNTIQPEPQHHPS